MSLYVCNKDAISYIIISNPFEIGKTMKYSKFGTLNAKGITTNKRKRVIIATLENSTPAILNELLEITWLGKWKVECYVPNRDKHKVGVIWPVWDNTDLLKVKDVLSCNYKVHASKRLKNVSRQGWIASSNVKIILRDCTAKWSNFRA